ncbi:DUF805 domain-containing protein [Rubellimicrobium sp. CFH 75288]|uniref:DUF805 domain-containing protein n=1 Tax=Rubellimicrobium sp. CFH 75288 TaxID=2697034 RepID=UPI001411B859|nr:DUF805 domain-containing protein [Rubellimicrobium sp. CFH 75288]NAZ35283.1 DUF805 domain-containing protein [Rubellimicrobium sp. CFH 75288]
MGEQWWYAIDNRREGPVPFERLRALAREGRLKGDSLVWRDGLADWEPALRHVPELDGPDLDDADPAVPPPLGRTGSGDGAMPAWAARSRRDYRETVGMAEALRRFFRNYATFSGRSNRGEFWWAVLGLLLIGLAIAIVETAILGAREGTGPLSGLWTLATLIPQLALGARRLHDTGRSGWWQLLAFVPIVGIVVLIVWWAQRGEDGPNAHG